MTTPHRRRRQRIFTITPEARAVIDSLPERSASELVSRLIVRYRGTLELWAKGWDPQPTAAIEGRNAKAHS